MLLSAGVGVLYDSPDRGSFIVSSIITFIFGFVGLLFGRHAEREVDEREGYVIVASVWVVFTLFGLLPYYLSGVIPDYTDAWFETMSGFTTTGATILRDVEQLTPAAHFWRSLTQWFGGMGIVVLCVALLPLFGLGGMQLYSAEMNGLSYEKIAPRIADTAKYLWFTYFIITLFEVTLLWIEGMSLFDAVCHSLTTVSTGGFSTKNLGIGHYSNPLIHYTVIGFMIIAGLNQALIIFAFRGQRRRILQDEETKWFIRSIIIFSIFISACLFIQNIGKVSSINSFIRAVERSLRLGFFTTTSTITGTGFLLIDYLKWPSILWTTLFFLMCTGASSGSTSGGIKWIRLMIFFKSGITEFKKRIHPNAIIPVKINNRAITQQTTNNVMAYVVFYLLIVIVATLVFCGLGINFDEAFATAFSSINNVGPAIGKYGPTNNFASFPTRGKWVMTLVMLIGRLEIFTVLLLFTPILWKK